MCGITGLIQFSREKVNARQVASMMKTIKHRGPDDEGMFVENNVGLGFLRLSIIDLSKAGHQPMFSPDNRFVLVFNGEIFNYIELRETLIAKGHVFKTQTDTEVLLTAYIEWGEAMLPKLNGMWAFAIYDRRDHTLFCARDRYGIKPFYYYLDDTRFLFASEIPAILSALGGKPVPDQSALFDFLVFNRTDQNENTFFKGIKKLNHGHSITLHTQPSGAPKTDRITKWYDLRNELKEPFKDAAEFRDELNASIALRLRSDVPIGVCLSGGLDSSSIASLLTHNFDKKDLYTFSAVYGEGKYGDESKYIDLYRKTLPNMYFTSPDENTLFADLDAFVRSQTEPVAGAGPYAQFKVMELAQKHVTVTLDGQGADELLAGYHYFFGYYFKNLLYKSRYADLVSGFTHYIRLHRSLLGIKSLALFMLPERMRSQARAYNTGYIDRDFYVSNAGTHSNIAGELYGSYNLQDALINHFEYKLEHLLKWEDRNSMWFSLEARVPFLDHRLVERTLTLPDSDIIHKGMTKQILREAMRGILPEPIRMRRDKIGFGTPQDDWFRTPLFQTYIQDIIGSERFASLGLVDVKKVKKLYQKHLRREAGFGKEIWKWIHLERWFATFIDGSASTFTNHESFAEALSPSPSYP